MQSEALPPTDFRMHGEGEGSARGSFEPRVVSNPPGIQADISKRFYGSMSAKLANVESTAAPDTAGQASAHCSPAQLAAVSRPALQAHAAYTSDTINPGQSTSTVSCLIASSEPGGTLSGVTKAGALRVKPPVRVASTSPAVMSIAESSATKAAAAAGRGAAAYACARHLCMSVPVGQAAAPASAPAPVAPPPAGGLFGLLRIPNQGEIIQSKPLAHPLHLGHLQHTMQGQQQLLQQHQWLTQRQLQQGLPHISQPLVPGTSVLQSVQNPQAGALGKHVASAAVCSQPHAQAGGAMRQLQQQLTQPPLQQSLQQPLQQPEAMQAGSDGPQGAGRHGSCGGDGQGGILSGTSGGRGGGGGSSAASSMPTGGTGARASPSGRGGRGGGRGRGRQGSHSTQQIPSCLWGYEALCMVAEWLNQGRLSQAHEAASDALVELQTRGSLHAALAATGQGGGGVGSNADSAAQQADGGTEPLCMLLLHACWLWVLAESLRRLEVAWGQVPELYHMAIKLCIAVTQRLDTQGRPGGQEYGHPHVPVYNVGVGSSSHHTVPDMAHGAAAVSSGGNDSPASLMHQPPSSAFSPSRGGTLPSASAFGTSNISSRTDSTLPAPSPTAVRTWASVFHTRSLCGLALLFSGCSGTLGFGIGGVGLHGAAAPDAKDLTIAFGFVHEAQALCQDQQTAAYCPSQLWAYGPFGKRQKVADCQLQAPQQPQQQSEVQEAQAVLAYCSAVCQQVRGHVHLHHAFMLRQCSVSVPAAEGLLGALQSQRQQQLRDADAAFKAAKTGFQAPRLAKQGGKGAKVTAAGKRPVAQAQAQGEVEAATGNILLLPSCWRVPSDVLWADVGLALCDHWPLAPEERADSSSSSEERVKAACTKLQQQLGNHGWRHPDVQQMHLAVAYVQMQSRFYQDAFDCCAAAHGRLVERGKLQSLPTFTGLKTLVGGLFGVVFGTASRTAAAGEHGAGTVHAGAGTDGEQVPEPQTCTCFQFTILACLHLKASAQHKQMQYIDAVHACNELIEASVALPCMMLNPSPPQPSAAFGKLHLPEQGSPAWPSNSHTHQASASSASASECGLPKQLAYPLLTAKALRRLALCLLELSKAEEGPDAAKWRQLLQERFASGQTHGYVQSAAEMAEMQDEMLGLPEEARAELQAYISNRGSISRNSDGDGYGHGHGVLGRGTCTAGAGASADSDGAGSSENAAAGASNTSGGGSVKGVARVLEHIAIPLAPAVLRLAFHALHSSLALYTAYLQRLASLATSTTPALRLLFNQAYCVALRGQLLAQKLLGDALLDAGRMPLITITTPATRQQADPPGGPLHQPPTTDERPYMLRKAHLVYHACWEQCCQLVVRPSHWLHAEILCGLALVQHKQGQLLQAMESWGKLLSMRHVLLQEAILQTPSEPSEARDEQLQRVEQVQELTWKAANSFVESAALYMLQCQEQGRNGGGGETTAGSAGLAADGPAAAAAAVSGGQLQDECLAALMGLQRPTGQCQDPACWTAIVSVAHFGEQGCST